MAAEPLELFDPEGSLPHASDTKATLRVSSAERVSTADAAEVCVTDMPQVSATNSLATPPSSSARAVLDGVHGLLDQLIPVAQSEMSTNELGRLVTSAERALRRLTSMKFDLLRLAEDMEAAQRSGMTDTGAWMAKRTQQTGSAANRQTKLAGVLGDGSLPRTQQALRAGDVPVENAAVIAQIAATLPHDLTSAERDTIEEVLVKDAKITDAARLRQTGRAVLRKVRDKQAADAHHDKVLRSEEDAARAACRFTWHDNANGTMSGNFTVPKVAGDMLLRVLNQMTAPSRSHLNRASSGAGAFAGSSPHDRYADIDWAHQRGLAFSELLERMPTDHLSGKVNATVVITIDHAQLTDQLNEHPEVGHIDTDEEISPSQARLIACGAGILPVVLGGASLPLDLGRQNRFFSENQRVALATKYSSCAADGCDRPYAWCHLHHLEAWSSGGKTSLGNAVPLCGHHHRVIHDARFHSKVIDEPDGTRRVVISPD